MNEKMNNPHFFIVGGGPLQVKFINKVKANGYIAHVFDYNPACEGQQYADYFHLLSIDDIKGIYEVGLQY